MNMSVGGQGPLEAEQEPKRLNSPPSYWKIPTTEKPKVLFEKWYLEILWYVKNKQGWGAKEKEKRAERILVFLSEL